jgi:hypothetical protein
LLPLVLLEIISVAFNVSTNVVLYRISTHSLTLQQESDSRRIRKKRVCLLLVNIAVTTLLLSGVALMTTAQLFELVVLHSQHFHFVTTSLAYSLILHLAWYTLVDQQWRAAFRHRYPSSVCRSGARIQPTEVSRDEHIVFQITNMMVQLARIEQFT